MQLEDYMISWLRMTSALKARGSTSNPFYKSISTPDEYQDLLLYLPIA